MGQGTEPEPTGEARVAEPAARELPERGRTLSLFIGFAALAFAALRPALHGPPVSDDFVYIVYNPYLATLSVENLLAILDPWGPPTANTVNYAPVHLLLHALEVRAFGTDAFGYHAVNVVLHALNSALLVALLRASRVPAAAALLGGTLFALHPANVEAVAWIFQLKTDVALALALGALLALRRHAALATLLFALALLAKAAAVFALPMAAALVWARREPRERARRSGAWLALWALLLALYLVPQLTAFGYAVAGEISPDPWVRVRTIAAIGMRYLVMAATALGVSAFQEPPPATSPLDPWWLAALPAGALLGWRALAMLRRRTEEAAYWVGAAAAFAPISQVFPFVYPMADRYLYFVLPGLIGGAILWGAEWRERLGETLARRGVAARWPAALDRAALAAAVVLAVFFGVHSHQRAELWRSEKRLFADAAKHYPDGGNAHFLKAIEAIERGDQQAALVALRAAVDRGYDRVRRIPEDALLEPIRDTPGFRELVREIAGRHIRFGRERGYSSQVWLHSMALAHRDRGEYAEAAELLERALRSEGPVDRSAMIAELLAVRRQVQHPKRGGGGARDAGN